MKTSHQSATTAPKAIMATPTTWATVAAMAVALFGVAPLGEDCPKDAPAVHRQGRDEVEGGEDHVEPCEPAEP